MQRPAISEDKTMLIHEDVLKLNAIDIFCGAGGLSLGAERAGLNIALAVEHDLMAAETFKYNHPNAQIICDDISKIDPLAYTDKHPFIIFGGPPCQGFSTSNTKTRSLKNANNFLFKEFLRFVEKLKPKWFLFENVEGITTFDNGNTVKNIKALFEELGYQTKEAVLYASDYGVPQHRNRFFMVGNCIGENFTFPEKLNYKVSVGEAISDLPDLENGSSFNELQYKSAPTSISDYARLMRRGSKYSCQNFVSKNKGYVIERYRYIGQGENWRSIPNELMLNYSNKNNCHSGIYKRLDAEKPSIVISNYRKNMLIHPFQDRGLSVREAARLQSFPDNFKFKGTLMQIQQQIGNAVPPLLAEAIFTQIINISLIKHG